jgi:hypothetical protein
MKTTPTESDILNDAQFEKFCAKILDNNDCCRFRYHDNTNTTRALLLVIEVARLLVSDSEPRAYVVRLLQRAIKEID